MRKGKGEGNKYRNPAVCGECKYDHFNTGGMIYGCAKGQLAKGWPQEKKDCKAYRKKQGDE